MKQTKIVVPRPENYQHKGLRVYNPRIMEDLLRRADELRRQKAENEATRESTSPESPTTHDPSPSK